MQRVTSNCIEGNNLEINGYKGYTCIVRKRMDELRRLAVIFREDKIYQFVGYLGEEVSNFAKYDPFFMQIIKSFDRLDQRGRNLSKSLRIKKYVVGMGDTYKALADQSSVPYNAEEQLRLLNGDFPNRDLEVGQVIKLVQ
jgi:predicted Zn-dependent protease